MLNIHTVGVHTNYTFRKGKLLMFYVSRLCAAVGPNRQRALDILPPTPARSYATEVAGCVFFEVRMCKYC